MRVGCVLNVLDEHFLYVTEDVDMLSYDHQGGGGEGGGGVLNVLDEHFLYVTEDVDMLSYDHRGGGSGGWWGCINVLDEHFFGYGRCTRCTCCRMIIKGRGLGGGNVLDEHFRNFTEHVAVVDMLHCLTRFLWISCVNLFWPWSDFICM